MTKPCTTKKTAIFTATIRSNTTVGAGFYRISMDMDAAGSAVFSKVIPGQFAEFDVSRVALPPVEEIPEDLVDRAQRRIILRRPFSFCDVDVSDPSAGVRADVLYCVLGPATVKMTTLSKGDRISIIGPLGKGFSVPDGKTTALLVMGGMGAGPLMHMTGYLKANFPKMRTVAFAGAKRIEDLPFAIETCDKNSATPAELAQLAVEAHIATDDGSAGFRGFVTDCTADWLAKNAPDPDETILYACGPEPMLAQTAKLAGEHNIDCQISTERMMACGIGLCQSCAILTKAPGQTEGVYKLCCKDGPVFDSKEVIFE